MLSRNLLVACALAFCCAANCLTIDASQADDCLSKPNAPSPQGTHWYYRIDRATQRHCWYLGVEGGKVRARAPEAVSASRPAAAKERSRPIAEVNAEPEADEPQAAPTPEKAITRAVPAPAADQEFAAAAPLSTRWSGMPKTANAINYAPPAASSSYANEQSATDEPDDMPLIWPILTPAELAAAEPPAQSTTPITQLAAAFAAVLGLAALIVRFVFGSSATRKSRQGGRDEWPARTQRNMPMPARARLRTGRQSAETEASVRDLLRELQRRRDEAPCGDLDPRLRRVTA